MMVIPSRHSVLILGGTKYEREMGEMTFYKGEVVMTWNS
jgi:hypothetical protein